MKEILDELKSCLYAPTYGTGGMGATSMPKYKDFETWLLQSNYSKVGPYLSEKRFNNTLQYVVYSSLEEIFDVLMKCPQADYFWYSYNVGKLTWAEPEQDEVPSHSLRVNKERIKVFLRDIKINQLID